MQRFSRTIRCFITLMSYRIKEYGSVKKAHYQNGIAGFSLRKNSTARSRQLIH